MSETRIFCFYRPEHKQGHVTNMAFMQMIIDTLMTLLPPMPTTVNISICQQDTDEKEPFTSVEALLKEVNHFQPLIQSREQGVNVILAPVQNVLYKQVGDNTFVIDISLLPDESPQSVQNQIKKSHVPSMWLYCPS